MDEHRAAYFAGILDGEGTVHSEILHHTTRNPRYNVRVSVVNTDVALIRWIQENFGGYVYERHSASHPEWKTKYEWVSAKETIIEILESVLPYLIVKKQQAELGILLRKDIVSGNGRSVDRAYRQELCEKIRLLNQCSRPAAETKLSEPETVCDSPSLRVIAGGGV